MNLRVFAGCAAGFLAALNGVSAAEGDRPKSGGVRINLDEPAKSAPSGTSTRPSAPAAAGETAKAGAPAAATKKAAKKEAETPKIDGMEVARTKGGYLGIKIENNAFKVTFYDEEKKPAPVDVARIALRWPVRYQPNPERTVLLPSSDGKSMTSERTVRAPHTFKLFITLLKDEAPGDDPAAESYVIDFRA